MTNTNTAKNCADISQLKLGFIGGGNMAQALIGGILGDMQAGQIMVSDPSQAARQVLDTQGVHTTTDSMKLLHQADVVVLAIKPQLFASVLPELAAGFKAQLVISIAAGTTVHTISKLLGGYTKIVRCMPNTPALIQSGASGLYATGDVSAHERQLAERILGTSGMVTWVDDEQLMHAVTAISGSAPAYFFYFFEHMIKAGTDLGLRQDQAKQLAIQTALGAAKMALASEDSPAELRRKVTSPNGTTQAAIESMQDHAVGKHIEEAMNACVLRSQDISD